MSINLYPKIIHDGDLTPDAFGPEVDDICNEIHAACKGMGTDEKRLIKAMGSLSPEMRCKIPPRYEELFGKSLKKLIKSEFRVGQRDLSMALQLLSVDPLTCDCDIVNKACKGIGTDELLLLTVFCGRSNTEVDQLKKKYFDVYENDLGRILDGELSGDLQKLILNVLQASQEEFDPGYHTDDLMEEDAKKLYDLGQGKTFGTDEFGIFKVLCARPGEYLKTLNMKYAELHGFTLTKALEKELGGNSEVAAMLLMGMKTDPYETIAKLIDRACKGFGTNELLLTCTLIRYQPVMKQVMISHIELFGETIEDRIKSECRGDYERLLLELVAAAE